MKRRTVVITGASSGIGLETARQLATMGAHMVMVCRDVERGDAARTQVEAVASGVAPELIQADLLSQASIEAAAHEIRRRYGKIDVLINNAGAVFGRRELSPDGIEKTFAL